MKLKLVLALATLLMMAAPAFAGDCHSELAVLDTQLENANVSDGVRKEATYMRDEAEKACTAGNEQDAQEHISMARRALGIQG
ncbi:MAG: hypothetical protein G3M78_02530 [Candidatus Nitrohelix vancouverensis]|uniref:Uncharacterized protein n=1 Tax=Candidatus Nitrohelix vancouverensis TaxID=2705534 RepID=A0A7T0C0K2_9BACT|nr:MAG: hypothetical protein G3M78_02530 [Candidatus Nitrohelix vancouverensis]